MTPTLDKEKIETLKDLIAAARANNDTEAEMKCQAVLRQELQAFHVQMKQILEGN